MVKKMRNKSRYNLTWKNYTVDEWAKLPQSTKVFLLKTLKNDASKVAKPPRKIKTYLEARREHVDFYLENSVIKKLFAKYGEKNDNLRIVWNEYYKFINDSKKDLIDAILKGKTNIESVKPILKKEAEQTIEQKEPATKTEKTPEPTENLQSVDIVVNGAVKEKGLVDFNNISKMKELIENKRKEYKTNFVTIKSDNKEAKLRAGKVYISEQ